MTRKHISTYYDEVEDDGFILMGSRLMRALQEQNRRIPGRMRREREDGQTWYKRIPETYRDRS